MYFVKRLSRTAAVISLGLLTACGGGGGGSSNSGGNNNGTGNNPPPAPTFHANAGVAQKGPLISGSTVTVQELDAALSPTGRQFSYQISSDLGTFSPTSTFNSQYLGVNATGYYFDEVLGATSTGPVTLNSYNDLSTDSALNVNLLTTLAYQRIKNLTTNSGMTFAAARAQAEGEVLKALNVPLGSYGSFGTLDLKGNSDGDRLLAVVSSLFVNGNHAGNLSTLINSFQSDLGANGTLTNPATKAALAASATTLNPSVVATNLTNRYASLGVVFSASDLARWIDSDGDGIIGKFEFRVPDATPSTLFTLPAAVVSNLVGKSISAPGAALSVNGTPISNAVTIAANDVVTVSPGIGSFPNGVLKVYLMSQNQRVASVAFVSGLLSIDVTSVATSIPKGVPLQFIATGHFSDTSTADLTQSVAWSSSHDYVATINTSGLSHSFATGNTTITATSGSIAGSKTLEVTPAELTWIAIAPETVRSGVGLTAQLTATGTYTDATTANVTSQANWSSSNETIVTINEQTGVTTGVALGNATIRATIGSLTGSAPIAIIANEFSAGPAAPVGFGTHTATLLTNGKVVAIGTGPNTSWTAADVAIYDPATQTWSRGASGHIERRNHAATLLANGQILVTGGGGQLMPMADTDLYDPATDHWTHVADMSVTRMSHSSTRLNDGRVLIAGGRNTNNSSHTSAQLFDPDTNTWSAAGSMAVARSEHTATLLADGRVLVTGGMFTPFPGDANSSAEIYDPATNTWSSAASMASARVEQRATLLGDGRVLVSGGLNQAGAEIYDPVADSWAPAGTLSNMRYAHTASLLADGRVLVAGGFGSGSAMATSELYDPMTNTWSPGPTMTVGRARFTATTLLNGVVLLIGSRDGGTFLSSTELYW